VFPTVAALAYRPFPQRGKLRGGGEGSASHRSRLARRALIRSPRGEEGERWKERKEGKFKNARGQVPMLKTWIALTLEPLNHF